MEISMSNIITFIKMTTDDEHPVCPIRESPEYIRQVKSAGAHYANKPYIGGVLQSGNSSQVSSTVASPMADKT
jgi:hypothetical protein